MVVCIPASLMTKSVDIFWEEDIQRVLLRKLVAFVSVRCRWFDHAPVLSVW